MMQTLRALAEEAGATFHLGAEVEQVLVKDGEAVGVQVGGERLDADSVVVNADLAYGMQNLIQPSARKEFSDQWFAKAQYSCSTVMLYWGLSRKVSELDHHNVFLADDYEQNLQDIYFHRRVRSNASFYAWNPSLIDDFFAPEGKSILYILFPTTNLQSQVDWTQAVEQLRETALDRLVGHGIKDMRQLIESEIVVTPLQWSQDFNVFQGATFNLSHTLGQIGPFRPPNKDRDIDHLYWVGGGTHPGSGLPIIFKGAENTVKRLMADRKRRVMATQSKKMTQKSITG